MYTMSGNDALKQYQQIGTTITVDDSSPHRLIQMMMEHVLSRINFARGHMERNEVEKKGKNIGDAISVISGLQVSLNHKANQRMSENFDALYAYMTRRLLQANLDDDPTILDEVAGLMRELKEAWDAIADDPEVIVSAKTNDS
jgi:flagellar protein FliS